MIRIKNYYIVHLLCYFSTSTVNRVHIGMEKLENKIEILSLGFPGNKN